MFIFLSHNIFSLQIFIQPVLHSLKSYDTTLAILVGTKNENISLERKYFNMFMKILMIVVLNGAFTFSQNYGGWTEIDSMNIARVGHAMVVLPNGNVLVSGSEADSIQSSCEIYEFSTGKWRYTAPMNIPRALHNLVLLNTGQVLAIGGYKEQSCELFDPQTETWTMTDSIPTFRFTGQTVTELADGKIMVTGGYYIDTTSWDVIILKKVDVYNPVTEIWIEATQMNLERTEHTATLLNDGRVLVTGGETNNFTTSQCEIFIPSTNTWELIGNLLEERSDHAALLLNNDKVFICGGDGLAPWQKSCEVYDVNTGIWSYASDMLAYRANAKLYFFKKVNKILILGGDGLPSSTEDTWEIYDPNVMQPVFLESFPINQFLLDNNIQLLNGDIFLAGNEEYDFNPMPYSWPTERSWLFDVTTNVNEDVEIIKSYKLNQNFPNPFNQQTTISYTLQSFAIVKLVIYDILGKQVEMLVNQVQHGGSYTVNFNAKDLSSGIYYYRLIISETGKSNGFTFQQTKKMVLLR